MLKVRYYSLKAPRPESLREFTGWADNQIGRRIEVLDRRSGGLVLRYTTVRQIETIQFDDAGTEVRTNVPSVERYSLRIFSSGGRTIVCLLDPPRGTRVVTEVLNTIFDEGDFFFAPVEISQTIIGRHTSMFSTAKLVTARIRDFRVYDNAVGRLEVSSKDGLPPEIAPFLGSFFRIDALTYEVIDGFQRGQITYQSNGTVRASQLIVEKVFPTFEACLVEDLAP